MDKDTIVIIDYGRGNLHSVYNGLLKVGASPVVSGDPKVIAEAPRVILPGVGSFGDCMDTMRSRGLEEAVQEALHSGKPFLGICLGEQLLFEGSEEAPGVKGLGYFKGQVKKIVTGYKIPHMGWNRISTVNPSPLMEDADGKYVYFVHSFHAVPDDPSIITSVCDYGTQITASVGRGSVQGFQFHPEKSSFAGLAMLKAFKEWKL
ncbi:imidazole glycerol phosphate synthase subunit HisH [uncultured Acidaminococcus sp.]|uniref:imidazole glycerol phosphate synthase subunit HisH n=1 Tax=uncultured Acidaminococcus sp. TaxID=352152 RepID=UPI00261AFB1A|nr:imidazole glycerol phosphate synthase subunit HisH [uncultured Acidaminococcus sp.]